MACLLETERPNMKRKLVEVDVEEEIGKMTKPRSNGGNYIAVLNTIFVHFY